MPKISRKIWIPLRMPWVVQDIMFIHLLWCSGCPGYIITWELHDCQLSWMSVIGQTWWTLRHGRWQYNSVQFTFHFTEYFHKYAYMYYIVQTRWIYMYMIGWNQSQLLYSLIWCLINGEVYINGCLSSSSRNSIFMGIESLFISLPHTIGHPGLSQYLLTLSLLKYPVNLIC